MKKMSFIVYTEGTLLRDLTTRMIDLRETQDGRYPSKTITNNINAKLRKALEAKHAVYLRQLILTCLENESNKVYHALATLAFDLKVTLSHDAGTLDVELTSAQWGEHTTPYGWDALSRILWVYLFHHTVEQDGDKAWREWQQKVYVEQRNRIYGRTA